MSDPPIKLRPTRKRTTLSRRAVALFLLLCSVVGLIALYPRVTIIPDGQINRLDNSSLSFVITNSGFVPLWHVQPELGICSIQWGIPNAARPTCDGPLQTKLVLIPWMMKT